MEIFKGLHFSISGFEGAALKTLKNAITKHAGKITGLHEKKTTHLITTSAEFTRRADTVLIAERRRLRLVTDQFIHDSIASSKCLDEEFYTPTTIVDNAAIVPTASNPAQPTAPKPTNIQGKWRTARIFISSTFRDMHGERDYLTRYVFPELQERCRKRRVHVTPIDLRWGVTEDDTDKALEICLQEVENCRPFFLGIIGMRYGWAPFEYKIPENLPILDWVRNFPPGHSITHLEMYSGVLRNPANSRGVFCFRSEDFISGVPHDYRSDFNSENDDYAQKLERLKSEIREKCSSDCILEDYPCSWAGVVDGKPMVGDLEVFGNHVLEKLWDHMCAEFPEDVGTPDTLALARSYHEGFVENHSRHFVGRKGIINKITEYNFAEGDKPLLILGEPGSGKTSLVAAFVKQFSASYYDWFVIPHFVGAAPGSTSIRETIIRVCKELSQKFHLENDVPETWQDLKEFFMKVLTEAAEKAVMRRKYILIVFDAVNQFDETNNPSNLEWFPESLPKGVKFVVSTLSGIYLDNLRRRGVLEVHVGDLSIEERKEIVRQTLGEYRKKLDEKPGSQMDLLLAKTDAFKPLYLVTACEELRIFGVYEHVTDRIATMSDTVPGLLDEVLQRLEGDFDLVRDTLLLLERSRNGLLETELLHLLGKNGDPLPSYIWSRLYRSLAAFLRPPGESGEGMLDFFHRQLAKAVKRRYIPDTPAGRKAEMEIQERLANYFLTKADPNEDFSFSSNDRRALSELPHHLLRAQSWELLSKVLGSLLFIEKKCEQGMAYDLANDYVHVNTSQEALSVIRTPPLLKINEFHQFFQGRTHILSNRPELTVPMALTLPDFTAPAIAAAERIKEDTRSIVKYLNKPQQSDPCLMTLAGHSMVVHCVDISKDGQTIISASFDHTIKTWNMKTGAEVLTLKGHSSSVFGCALSPNQNIIASASFDKTAKLWNATTGAEIRTLHGHGSKLTDCSFTPSGTYLATSSGDRTVRFWRVSNGEAVGVYSFEDVVLTVQCLSDTEFILSCGNYAKLYNRDVGIMASFEAQKPVITAKANDRYVATGSDDRMARVYDRHNNSLLHTLGGHKDGVRTVAFTSDSSRLVTGSFDNFIFIWNMSTGAQIATLIGHTGTVYSCILTPDDNIVSCSFDRTVKVWETSRAVNKVEGHGARILGVASNGNKIVTASRDKTIRVWNKNTFTTEHVFSGHASNVTGCDITADGTLIVSSSRDSTVRLWNTTTLSQIAIFREHTGTANGVKFINSEEFVSVGEDGTMRVWDHHSCQAVHTDHKGEAYCIAVSKDRRRIATGGEDKNINIYDAKTFKKVAVLHGHVGGVTCLAFSPDGRYLVSGGDDKLVIEWNARTARQLRSFKRHEAALTAVDYTNDGSCIISGSTDSMIIYTDRGSWEETCAFACKGRVTCMAADPSSNWIMAGDGSGSLYVLNRQK